MKLLFIIILICMQEPVKKTEPVKSGIKLEVDKEYYKQNIQLDSIIATLNALNRYSDTIDSTKIKVK